MTTRRMGSMVMIGAAMAFATGVALAKPHEGHGNSGHGSHGQGKAHGRPDGKGGGPGDAVGDDGAKHGKGGGAGKSGGRGGACDELAASTIGAFVDSTCPCDGLDDGTGTIVPWKNHGRYVRCVAHAVRDAVRAAGVKRRCVRDLVPCAARSTCGKRNAVTCVVVTSGTCVDGACSDDADVPCATDADCAARACGITSAARCAEAGGTAGSGSCCSASPSGAFLD